MRVLPLPFLRPIQFSTTALLVTSTLGFIPSRSFPTTAASAFFHLNQKTITDYYYKNTNYRATSTISATQDSSGSMMSDPQYPGTAVERLVNSHNRIQQLVKEQSLLNQPWAEIRRKILWAGGLKDLPDAIPGQGYTGHSFNDFNHVDLTCMLDQVSDNENDGSVQGIAIGNRLGSGIRVASDPTLGPGGSWSTCMIGCSEDPPNDVAHIQFRARIAFKLVWVPNDNFDEFVLVDDDGKLLAHGKPNDGDGNLPPLRERQMNFRVVQGSKYASEATKAAGLSTAFE